MSEMLSPKNKNTPTGWRAKDGELFDVFYAYNKIGSCALTLVERQSSPRKGEQFFPDSWFVYKNSELMLPVLEITGLETLQQKNAGNGRLCLQALYNLSKKRGCDGRMQVLSDFNSASFYEHCGFSGGSVGEDGLKYFDPTPKNLSCLFPNGVQQVKCLFILSPKTTSKKLSQIDKELFNRMIQKGPRS